MIRPKRTIPICSMSWGATCVFYIVGNDMKLYLLDFTSMVESAFFLIGNILSKWEIKKWKFEKSDFGDFQLLDVRGKKGGENC